MLGCSEKLGELENGDTDGRVMEYWQGEELGVRVVAAERIMEIFHHGEESTEWLIESGRANGKVIALPEHKATPVTTVFVGVDNVKWDCNDDILAMLSM